jgi:hypothetical protein
MKELVIKGTGMIHSRNMLDNLAYAYRVKDKQFIKTWFPVLFGNVEAQEQEAIKAAFVSGKMNILDGPNDSDALLEY